MDVDPRRQASYRLIRKLFKILKKQDEYLNREMVAPGKKLKKDIPLVDLMDDKDPKGKIIEQSDEESSADEGCTHIAFLTPAPTFGDESGDEDNFDKEGNFIIAKIEPPEYPEEQIPPPSTFGEPNQETEHVKAKGKGKGKRKEKFKETVSRRTGICEPGTATCHRGGTNPTNGTGEQNAPQCWER